MLRSYHAVKLMMKKKKKDKKMKQRRKWTRMESLEDSSFIDLFL